MELYGILSLIVFVLVQNAYFVSEVEVQCWFGRGGLFTTESGPSANGVVANHGLQGFGSSAYGSRVVVIVV